MQFVRMDIFVVIFSSDVFFLDNKLHTKIVDWGQK